MVFLTLHQVARALGISYFKAQYLVKEGKLIPAGRRGKAYGIDTDTFMTYVLELHPARATIAQQYVDYAKKHGKEYSSPLLDSPWWSYEATENIDLNIEA